MFRLPRFISLLLIFALTFSDIALAIELEISSSNIGQFHGATNKPLGAHACFTGLASPELGLVTFEGKKAALRIGAHFSSLSPSIEKRLASLRKKMNSTERQIGREKRLAAKSRLRKSQNALTQTIRLLQMARTWCSELPVTTYQPPNQSPTQPPRDDSSPDGNYNPPPLPTNEPEEETIVEAEAGPTHVITGTVVSGRISGGPDALITLGNDQWLESRRTINGEFTFEQVPVGTYFIHAEREQTSFGPSHTVVVAAAEGTSHVPLIQFEGQSVPTRGFRYSWHDEALSRSGHEYHAQAPEYVAGALEAASTVAEIDTSAEQVLQGSYQITLSDSEVEWSQEHADRMLKTILSVWDSDYGDFPVQKKSIWVLTRSNIPDDIEIDPDESELRIRINIQAFSNAEPQSVTLDGERGVFFSRRLYKALSRYITNEGKDYDAIERILQWRYNATTIIQDYYVTTYWTTAESAQNFQAFTPSELISILATLAELPEGMARSDYTLRLVRRKNSVPHPLYRSTAAVAWLGRNPWQSYVEFMYNSFSGHPLDAYRTILMVRSGIIWQQKLSEALKKEWYAVSGWVYNSATDTWTNSNPTEVGEILIGDENPAPLKDFMSSMAEYVVAPERLRFRSPGRFEYIRHNVMSGYRYLQQVREDLRFDVLNLRPDYSFPGKINSVQISVRGRSDQDKQVTIDLGLEGDDLMKHGATFGLAQIYNSRSGARMSVYFSAVDPELGTGLSLKLRASFTISKYAASGPWDTTRIHLWDGVGNMRTQNRDSFGWKLFVINALESLERPVIVPGSTTISLGSEVIDGRITPHFKSSVRILHPSALAWGCIYIRGTNRPEVQTASCNIIAPGHDVLSITAPFHPATPSDDFGVSYVVLQSIGSQQTIVYYSPIPKIDEELMPIIPYASDNADETPPEIDLDSIIVDAQAVRPESPDGETVVTVRLKVRDNFSGAKSVYFCLKSPLDRYQCESFRNEALNGFYPTVDPTAWRDYYHLMVIPKGSAPGSWGVSSVGAVDRAGNSLWHMLTETIHFEVNSNSQ